MLVGPQTCDRDLSKKAFTCDFESSASSLLQESLPQTSALQSFMLAVLENKPCGTQKKKKTVKKKKEPEPGDEMECTTGEEQALKFCAMERYYFSHPKRVVFVNVRKRENVRKHMYSPRMDTAPWAFASLDEGIQACAVDPGCGAVAYGVVERGEYVGAGFIRGSDTFLRSQPDQYVIRVLLSILSYWCVLSHHVGFLDSRPTRRIRPIYFGPSCRIWTTVGSARTHDVTAEAVRFRWCPTKTPTETTTRSVIVILRIVVSVGVLVLCVPQRQRSKDGSKTQLQNPKNTVHGSKTRWTKKNRCRPGAARTVQLVQHQRPLPPPAHVHYCHQWSNTNICVPSSGMVRCKWWAC